MKWLVLVSLVSVAAAQTDPWSIGLFPNPRQHPERCNRPSDRPSFLCDPDGVLTRDQANQLDTLLEDIRNKTNCPCSRYQCEKDNRGYQIGISLVNRMETPEADNDMERVSANLNQAKMFSYVQLIRWEQMGQCDENVMVFYSVEDNVLYTMTGEIARKKLSNRKIGHITMNRRREFGFQGRDAFFNALKHLVEDYRSVFLDNYREPKYAGSGRPRTAASRGRSGGAGSVVASTGLLLLAAVAALWA